MAPRKKAPAMKTTPAAGAEIVNSMIAPRFAPVRGLTPERLSRELEQFDLGYLRDLALLMETVEKRDYTLKVVAAKRKKSVARNEFTIVQADDSPTAVRHAEILRKFWGKVRCTSAVDLNHRGGIKLLIRQMMDAASKGYAVHEIVWMPSPDGLRAEFRFVPLWFFDNTTGELAFQPAFAAVGGTKLVPGEWMVTVGDGLMIAALICYMFKTLPMKDWLVYSARQAGAAYHAESTATPGSKPWNDLVAAMNALATGMACVTSAGEKINKIDLQAAGELPYPPLVQLMDRAMAALYRGGDLSTISADNQGSSVQGGESALLEDDDCTLISETWQEQVDRYVIEYETGDTEPMAYIKLLPTVQPDSARDIVVDEFLVKHGVRLSKSERAEFYGRQIAKDEDDAMTAPAAGAFPPAPPVPLPNTAPVDPASDEAIQKILDGAMEELPLAQIKALGVLVERFRPIYDRLKAGETLDAVRPDLRALRDELPAILQEMGVANLTGEVLNKFAAWALIEGIGTGAEQVKAATR